ncbi:MAG: hypothetical protein LUQ07_00045 [Methanospirillum sp.]|nr:hypothetical protein [Methanospirillum sp.]
MGSSTDQPGPVCRPVREEIRETCNLLFVPGQVAEVRALGKWIPASGYFDDFDRLAASVTTLENKGEYSGIYITLNPVNPDLLARRANRIETRLGKHDTTTSDTDILCRRWLPIDVDPVRPAGVSSTDAEHEAALIKAVQIAAYLADIGWPEPVMADSGNGAHLLYRVDLPNDTASRDLIKGVLETLHLLFSDSQCEVDRSVSNAGRIWKLYGTTSRKGDHIASRPHRKAIIDSPGDQIPVCADRLSSLAGMFPAEQPAPTFRDRRRGEPIVLRDWLGSHGIGFIEKPYLGGSIFVLDACPFSSDHQDGAYAIQFANGAIFAGCHHNSCGSGSQRWSELREMFEGTVEERLRRMNRRSREEEEIEGNQHGNQARNPEKIQKEQIPTGRIPTDTPDERPGKQYDAGDEVSRETLRILQEDSPLRHMLDTFGLDHIGDPVVAECLVMSLASRLVINAKGLHVSVTGESGKGKSHTFDTMMQQVPEELRLEGRMSDKALFYIKGMRPGSVIALDDVSLSDAMQEVLKGVTTSFKKPFTYRTVDKDRGGKTCVIPERCVWWVAKVDGTGDDQVWNRMLTCWIDDSVEQDALVLSRMLSEATVIPGCGTGARPEVIVCQEMWRMLRDVWVVVPFAERIRFSSSLNRRNPDMLLDLVKAHAVLMQFQRERNVSGDMTVITATEEDFREAARLYSSLNGTSGGQETKLTKREYELVETIRLHGHGEITIGAMQHLTGLSQSVVYKMIHGSTTRGTHYSGLLEKCPALTFCERTLVSNENGTTTAYRRERAFAWDDEVYHIWAGDGRCWLDPHDLHARYDPHDNDPHDFHDVPDDPAHSNEPEDPGEPDHEPSDARSGIAVSSGSSAVITATKKKENCGSEEEKEDNSKYNNSHSGKSECMQQGICDP